MTDNVRGTLPTPQQREDANTLFYDGGKCSCDKVSAHTAMHRDAIGDIQVQQDSMTRFVDGDEHWPGAKTVLIAIHKNQTGSDVTTKKVKDESALEKNSEKVFVIRLRAVIFFLKWAIGTIIAIGGLYLAIS